MNDPTQGPGYTSSDDSRPGPLSAIYGADKPAQPVNVNGPRRPPRRVQLVEKLSCLFTPMRYKIAYGGRGSGKTTSCARALLIMGSARRLRVLCCREIQNSIEESVHASIRYEIEAMNLDSLWEVQKEKIKCAKTGSEFIFAGLSTQTEKSIKGYANIDVVWVEEAESVRESSWKLLIPTIRKDGSFGPGTTAEIWISMNPDLDTSYSYKTFIEYPPPDSFVVKVNWRDNPWFPKTLEAERQHAQRTMTPDEYNNIWEGMTRAAVQGAIYADQIAIMRDEGRYGMVPWNPKLPVHLVFDLGWNDTMAIIMVQKHLQALAIIEAIEVDHTTLETLTADVRYGRKYRWGQVWLPHDGEHGDYKTGLTALQIMRNLGWPVVKPVQKLGIEEGIKIARGALPMTHIDQKKAEPLMTALRTYRRKINKHGEGTGPEHDAASHMADCYRYLAIAAPRITNDPPGTPAYTSRIVENPIDAELGM